MQTYYSPTAEDLDRYMRLRAASMKLSQRIFRTVPKQAYDDIGGALGFLRNGVLVFDSEDMTGVMADCCIFDWYEDGKTFIQRYAETHPAESGTDEHYLMDAYLHTKYRMLMVQHAVPGAGIDCHDLLNQEAVFLMDTGLSRTAPGGGVLATRTIPLGPYSMTGGAGLPVTSGESLKNALKQIEKGAKLGEFQGSNSASLWIVRACLDAGAAEHIAYELPKAKRREPRHFTRRNRRRG